MPRRGGPKSELRYFNVTLHVPTNRPGISDRFSAKVLAANAGRACSEAIKELRRGPLKYRKVLTVQFNVSAIQDEEPIAE